jgi:glutaconate CoA-transferase subunit B
MAIIARTLDDLIEPITRFRLASVHPGHSVAEVIENTGFDFDRPAEVPTTAAPTQETLHLMRDVVAPQLAEVYPQFAKSVFGIAASVPSADIRSSARK